MKKNPSRPLLRVIDANFNRAKEALRVAEDLSRFILNDKKLAAQFKKTRHELSRVLISFPVSYIQLLVSRDSSKDVGKTSHLQDRKKNPNWQDLMTANLKRAQEALRVLEECAKIVSPQQSKRFQKIRFQCYELETRSLLKF